MSAENSDWDAIVIGSGLGGMSCAAALAKHNWKVLVLEQHYVAGGCTHMFSRKGYRWDVGVHVIGQMTEREMPGRILNWLTDGNLKMESLGPVYDSVHFPGGLSLEFPNNKRAFQTLLKNKFPNETQAIDRYFQLLKDASDTANLYFGAKTLPEIIYKLAAPFIRSKTGKWWFKTTEEVLNEINLSKELKAVLLSQWGYYGAPPSKSSFAIHAVTIKHFLYGGYYPVGGAKSFAETLSKTIESAGGKIVTRAFVKEILIENGKTKGVRLKDDKIFLSDTVVSAAGAKTTVQNLLPASEQKKPWAVSIAALEQSPSYVTLYMGFEGDIAKAGATKANQFYFETTDVESSFWDLADEKALAPCLYISFPSLKDPKHEPGPNQMHTGEVVTFVSWDLFEKWKHTRRGNRESDYMELKKQLEQRMLAQAMKYLPNLKPLLKFHELSTPLSANFFIQAPQGAIYGLNPTPRRFATEALKPRTPVKGLYLSGCDVATLGVAGALAGGILTAGTLESKILKRLIR